MAHDMMSHAATSIASCSGTYFPWASLLLSPSVCLPRDCTDTESYTVGDHQGAAVSAPARWLGAPCQGSSRSHIVQSGWADGHLLQE